MSASSAVTLPTTMKVFSFSSTIAGKGSFMRPCQSVVTALAFNFKSLADRSIPARQRARRIDGQSEQNRSRLGGTAAKAPSTAGPHLGAPSPFHPALLQVVSGTIARARRTGKANFVLDEDKQFGKTVRMELGIAIDF
jgi:hypothetical protein